MTTQLTSECDYLCFNDLFLIDSVKMLERERESYIDTSYGKKNSGELVRLFLALFVFF